MKKKINYNGHMKIYSFYMQRNFLKFTPPKIITFFLVLPW